MNPAPMMPTAMFRRPWPCRCSCRRRVRKIRCARARAGRAERTMPGRPAVHRRLPRSSASPRSDRTRRTAAPSARISFPGCCRARPRLRRRRDRRLRPRRPREMSRPASGSQRAARATAPRRPGTRRSRRFRARAQKGFLPPRMPWAAIPHRPVRQRLRAMPIRWMSLPPHSPWPPAMPPWHHRCSRSRRRSRPTCPAALPARMTAHRPAPRPACRRPSPLFPAPVRSRCR